MGFIKYTSSKEEMKKKQINETFVRAVEAGNKFVIQELLNKDADVNYSDNNGFSALHHAVEKGHFQLISLLVLYGADLEKKSSWYGYKPIHMLKDSTNKEKCLEELIKCHVQLDSVDDNMNSILHIFVEECPDSVEFIVELIGRGLDPKAFNDSGYNCLHLLSFYHSTHEENILCLAELFLKNGVQIDLRSNDVTKETALHIATRYNNFRLVDLLLAHGADINAENYQGIKPIDILFEHVFLSSPFTRDVYIKHIVLRIHRGENISDRVTALLNSNETLVRSFRFFENCMNRLKHERIHENYKITCHDILCRESYQVAKYLSDELISKSVGELMITDYKYEMTKRVHEAQDILNKNSEAFPNLHELFRHELPYNCISTISTYYFEL